MWKKRTTPVLGVVMVLLTVSTVLGTDYALDWYTIDGGGKMFSTGGDFELSGTVGQPDANTTIMTGGEFELAGGFWPGCTIVPEPCPGDVDGDQDTDLTDLATLLSAYGSVPDDPNWNPACDFDGDSDVDLSDLAFLLSDYGCP